MKETVREEGAVAHHEHKEVYEHIKKLLASRAPIPFSFSLKEDGKHVLAILHTAAQKIGLPEKTIIISHENPWIVYASLALMVISSGAGI